MNKADAPIVHRAARAQDFFSVYAIYMHADVVPFLGFDPMPADAFAAVFDALVAGGGFHIAEIDGEVVGFYRVRHHEGRAAHVAYLGTLAVAPGRTGHGIGRRMIEELTARLRDEGIVRVELMVEADNARAIALYERLGFVHEGRLRAAYRRSADAHYTDELLMAKLLAPIVPAAQT